MKAWADRHEGRSAGTDEFIAFATRYTHRDLTRFLRDWLYGTKTPPLAGPSRLGDRAGGRSLRSGGAAVRALRRGGPPSRAALHSQSSAS